MIGAVLLLAVLCAHAFGLARAWWGEAAPDPLVLLVAGLALQGRPRVLLAGAVITGWLRALVLLEPAGGQVLCAWLAVTVVAGMRPTVGPRALLTGSVVAAGVWAAAGELLGWVTGQPVSGTLSLLTGALLALPLTVIAGLRRRRREALFT